MAPIFAGISLPAMLILLVSSVALGQTPTPDDQDGEKREGQTSSAGTHQAQPPPQEERHDEITVTATRTPTPLREIGQSVTLITAEEMEAQGARDILQVLETVPGFNVARTGSFGGTTSLFVRGGESDFNLVLLDGLQLNQPGGAYDFGDLTTANVERIEIVRGPSSVLYGADAVASVISIITRKGEGKPSGHFRFEGGSFDSLRFDGGVQGGTGKLHYSLGAQYFDTEGFHDFNNSYDKVDLSTRLDFQLSPSSSISATARYNDSKHHFPTDSTGAVVDPNDFRKTDESAYSISYQKSASDRYGTKLHYGYFKKRFSSFTVEDGVVDFFNSTFETEESRNYIDWQNSFNVNPANLLTAGVSYEREESQTIDISRQSVGVYVQEQFTWKDRLFLTGGVRHDDNSRFQSFTTASASAAFLIDDAWKVRASIGNGFRAPTFSEIIGFPSFGIAGNENLKPEKNTAGDLGIDFVSTNLKSRASATVFFNRFSDLIEFTFLAPAGASNFVNIEAAQSQGFELDGSISATRWLGLGGQYTLTETEVTDSGTLPGGSFARGESLLRRPRNLAGLYIQFLHHRCHLRIDFKFKGKRDDIQFFPDFSSSRVVLPSYWKADFAVTVPLLRSSSSNTELALNFRGENLFDKEYTEVAGFESIGRSLMAGFQISY